jgi:hypothetical protein
MPWLFNPTRDVHPVELVDGSAYGFLPRKKVYIDPANVSAAVWRLVQVGKLANQGGDPVAAASAAVPSLPVISVHVEPVHPAKPDTSSSHHQTDGRVTVDSSSASNDEKESKVVKKQDDDLKKATTDLSEVAAEGSDNSVKTEKRSKKSRKR